MLSSLGAIPVGVVEEGLYPSRLAASLIAYLQFRWPMISNSEAAWAVPRESAAVAAHVFTRMCYSRGRVNLDDVTAVLL
jgi:hypothetical protein